MQDHLILDKQKIIIKTNFKNKQLNTVLKRKASTVFSESRVLPQRKNSVFQKFAEEFSSNFFGKLNFYENSDAIIIHPTFVLSNLTHILTTHLTLKTLTSNPPVFKDYKKYV